MERHDATGWDGVRERVLALGSSTHGQAVFGAVGHEFRLAGPLADAELSQAEAQWGVRLPEDYRAFLQTVGAGSAGPHYGLVELRRDGQGWGWETRRHEVATDAARLGEAFPGPIDPERLRDALAAEPDEDSFGDGDGDGDGDEVAYEEWRKGFEDWYFADDHTVGAVYLAHHGCAVYDWLIVSGPYRGQVWTDDRASDGNLSHTAPSFGDWYLGWLDTAEATVARAA